jgi:putative transposase
MARLPRLTVAGYPHHIIQRGNNRQDIFTSASDRRLFLNLLSDNAAQFKVAIHAYVLMGNHVHLLATPETADGIPRMMQALGRRYVRLYNDSHGRTGTLWEGRYKSTLIQTERYLLACMAYIDLNPVRAGLVAHPSEYAWSSHLHYAGDKSDPVVTPHPLIWGLGNTPFAREAAYREWVLRGLTTQQLQDLTQSVLKGWALGEQDFVASIQSQTARRVSRSVAGRPVGTKRSPKPKIQEKSDI